jgi:hypothetical protein
MYKARLTRLFWLVMLMALLAGCGAPASPPTPTPMPPSPSPIPSATFTPLPPTETPTPLPTDTPTPTVTPLPTQSISSIANALMPVTQGSGVTEAAAYDPNKPGVHPIIVITVEDQAQWNNGLPESWRPMNVGQTELVVSIRINRVVVETKLIKMVGFLNRFRTDTEIWLREAQTGKLIVHTIFEGEDPPQFHGWVNATTIIGAPIPAAVVVDWLKGFVEK